MIQRLGTGDRKRQGSKEVSKETRNEDSAGRPPSRNAISEGTVSWSFGLGNSIVTLPTPPFFFCKSVESFENKGVEFLLSAKKRKRVRTWGRLWS